MKKAFFCLAFLLILLSVCSALTTDDDGYAWNTATYEEKKEVEIELQKLHSTDIYIGWIPTLNEFYDTTDKNVLSIKIKESTPVMKAANSVYKVEKQPLYPVKSVGTKLTTKEESMEMYKKSNPPSLSPTREQE